MLCVVVCRLELAAFRDRVRPLNRAPPARRMCDIIRIPKRHHDRFDAGERCFMLRVRLTHLNTSNAPAKYAATASMTTSASLIF